MTARYVIGDVREVLRSMPDGSVDLVLTSPPFLALRSYLPADHPDKALEIGSEATPADFLDVLLDLTVEWRRVLAPHGSICVELGDTYSGSGGAGGDYNDGGLREGAPVFDGNARRRRDVKHKRGGDDEAMRRYAAGKRDNPPPGWPMAKSLCGIPTLYAASLAYGRNLLRPEHTIEPWRVRNLIAWVRPNPPVGALGDKFRPATSYMTVACMSRTRFFDLDAVREPAKVVMGREVDGNNVKGSDEQSHRFDKRIDSNPAGAPPLDWWEIPTHPYPGSHYATFPAALCVRPIKAMCPLYVCPTCGPIQSNHDATSLSGMRRANHEPTSEDLLLAELRPGGDTTTAARASQGAWAKEDESVRLHSSALAGTPNGEQGGGGIRAPGDNGRTPRTDADCRRGGTSQERHQERQPHREPGAATQESSRQDEWRTEQTVREALSALRGPSGDDWLCSRCGGPLRKGLVLDPFAGSGTTLAVATGHGRDAIGIDIDARNATLALDRIGPLLCTVETFTGNEAVA